MKKARKLVQKDTVGPKAPEKLPGYIYREFSLNSDASNTSKIIRITFQKVKYTLFLSKSTLHFQTGETESCWSMDLKKRHGVIITEHDGQIEVMS